jgi:hypothetical protein
MSRGQNHKADEEGTATRHGKSERYYRSQKEEQNDGNTREGYYNTLRYSPHRLILSRWTNSPIDENASSFAAF